MSAAALRSVNEQTLASNLSRHDGVEKEGGKVEARR